MPKKSPRPKIRAFWTSRRLLEHVIRSTHLAVDTTFKLTWQGFPVFMCGTADMDKRYHPFGLGLCSEETFHDHAFIFDSIKKAALEVYGFELKPTVLLADAASEITNGFTRVFGEPEHRIFCWVHVERNIKKYLSGPYLKYKSAVLLDFKILQQSRSKEIFNTVSLLFLEKWQSKIPDFTEYFKEQWLEKCPGWY